MLTPPELRVIANTRLEEAEILYNNARYDGACYICGYVMEMMLKARICDTLNWAGFPQGNSEFKNLSSFKTHNLDVLLQLSGREQIIKQSHMADWSIVNAWNPEDRYRIVGAVSQHTVQDYLFAAKALMPVI